MKRSEDAQVIEAARFVAITRLNEWIGLPFDIGAAIRFVQRLPHHLRRIPQQIRKQGVVESVIGAVAALALMWFFAPFRQALIEMEVAIALLFVGVWLFLLPFILLGAGLHLGSLLLDLLKRWTTRRAKAVSRAAIRFVLLGSTYLIDLWYGQAIRAFVERSKDLSMLF